MSSPPGVADDLDPLCEPDPSCGVAEHMAEGSCRNPGTFKCRKIEHRLSSHITLNWRRRPLNSHEGVVKTIAATRSRTGLPVHAELDRPGTTRLGSSVSKQRMAALALQPATSIAQAINESQPRLDEHGYNHHAHHAALASTSALRHPGTPDRTGTHPLSYLFRPAGGAGGHPPGPPSNKPGQVVYRLAALEPEVLERLLGEAGIRAPIRNASRPRGFKV